MRAGGWRRGDACVAPPAAPAPAAVNASISVNDITLFTRTVGGGLLAPLYAVTHPGRAGRLALLCPAAITPADRRRTFELAVVAYFRDPERARDLTPFRVTGRTQQAVWDSLSAYDLRADLARVTVPARVLELGAWLPRAS